MSSSNNDNNDTKSSSSSIFERKGSFYHIIKIGSGRINPLSCFLVYFHPLLYYCYATEPIRQWLLWNAICQLVLFVPVVQIPAFLTTRMSYVDIGWPSGLVVLALNGLYYNNNSDGEQQQQHDDGNWFVSDKTICYCLLYHGLRMAVVAIIMFFPYRFDIHGDLTRYQYAKLRFLENDGMPSSWWWLKIQHDTLQQAFANMVCLACPILLSTIKTYPRNIWCSRIEQFGFVMFLLSSLWENIADVQMELFIRSKGNTRRLGDNKKKEDNTIIGFGKNSYSKTYCVWSYCRHPNYFGEWMVWNSFIVMSLPKVWYLWQQELEHPLVIVGLLLSLYFLTRMFYDCLLHWTGAEPAEYFSYRKRPLYGKYQEQTRVFFPLEIFPSIIDHGKVAGWPYPAQDVAKK